MALTILARPPLLAASKNPIIYQLKREDFQTTTTAASDLIRITGSDETSQFNQNDKIWLSTETTEKNRLVTVNTAVFTGGNTDITVFEDLQNDGAGYINLITGRVDYRVDVTLYDGAGEELFEQPFEYTPLQSGVLNADVSEALNSILVPSLSTATEVAGVLHQSARATTYYIVATERYNDTIGTQIDDSGNTRDAIQARQQVDDANFPSMANYLIKNGTTSAWLSRLDEGIIYDGFLNTVGGFFEENGPVIIRIRGYDINKANPVETDENIGSNINGVYYYSFKGDSQYGFQSIQAYVGTTAISQELFFRVENCTGNLLFLRYLNNLGGVTNIGLEYNQLAEATYDEAIEYENFGDLRSSSKKTESESRIRFSGDTPAVTRKQARIYDEIKRSPSVQVMNEFGEKIGVISRTNTSNWEQIAEKVRGSISVEFPVDFDPLLNNFA